MTATRLQKGKFRQHSMKKNRDSETYHVVEYCSQGQENSHTTWHNYNSAGQNANELQGRISHWPGAEGPEKFLVFSIKVWDLQSVHGHL